MIILKPIHVIPGDTIVFKEEVPRELYFVYQGALRVVSPATHFLFEVPLFYSFFWASGSPATQVSLRNNSGWEQWFILDTAVLPLSPPFSASVLTRHRLFPRSAIFATYVL